MHARPDALAAARPLPQEVRFTRVASGARIAWARSGAADPTRPLVLRTAHWLTHVGHDAVSPLFQPWLSRLGRQLRVLRYDERGCGMSGPDPTPLSIESALEEALAVADAAHAPRLALLGISGGAATAIAFAARHPERVSHLVLLGAYAQGALCDAPSAETRDYLEALGTLMRLGWGQRDSAVQQLFSTRFLPDASPAQREAMNEQQRRACDGARAAALLQARATLDVRADLARVRCATLVLHGEGDGMVPVEQGQAVAAGIEGALFETLATRNHVPLPGEPAFEHFCARVEGFLLGGPPLPDFSAAERTLLALVGQGLDNLQIAAHLGLAEKTVRNRLSGLYRRLGVEGRPQAIVRARELGA